MRHISLIAFCFLAGTTHQAWADEGACASLLQQDIHNKMVVIDSKNHNQIATSSLCQQSASSNSSSISVQYAGVGVGLNQADALAKAMCDNKFDQSDLSSGHSVYQSVIDPEIIQAAVECYKLNSKGLHYTIHSDPDTHSFGLAINYDGPNPISIRDIVIIGNAQCEGELNTAWQASPTKVVPLTVTTRGLTCTSKNGSSDTPKTDIPAGSVTVITDAGPIYADIPRRFSPSLEEQFTRMHNKLTDLHSVVIKNTTDVELLKGSQKLCGIDVVGSRMELTMVPHSWNKSLCDDYHTKVYPPSTIGKVFTRLGCLTPTGLSLGSGDGGLPPNNSCDW